MKSRGWSVYPKLEAYIYENYKSVAHFAWVVGVSPTTIYSILHGKSDPSPRTLREFLADERNAKAIKNLEQVLGKLRKVENYHANRSYHPRVNRMEQDQ